MKHDAHIFPADHDWSPVATDYVTSAMPRFTGTIVLYQCECGQAKTEVVDGEWTLEQVRDAVIANSRSTP